MNQSLVSSKNMNWCTPQDFFDKLDTEFHFTLDAAATEQTTKCANFFLRQKQTGWHNHGITAARYSAIRHTVVK